MRYPQAAPASASATGAERSSHTGISGCLALTSRQTNAPAPANAPKQTTLTASQGARLLSLMAAGLAGSRKIGL